MVPQMTNKASPTSLIHEFDSAFDLREWPTRMTHESWSTNFPHTFASRLWPTRMSNKNDLWTWPARIAHEFDPRESRDLAHSCISFLGRSHVMHPEEMKAKYMQKYVWKSFFNKPASWNPSTELRITFFKDNFQGFWLSKHLLMATSRSCTKCFFYCKY